VGADLIQIVDAAMAEAARRSGAWLVCRPGCTNCCIGPFPISMVDARRLQTGLAALDRTEPERGARVRRRAAEYLERLTDYPGDISTGILDEGADEDPRFDTLAEDVPCPALDPAAGTCELYEARPLTCRLFGPAVSRGGGPLGVCELCYQGATESEIAACQVDIDPEIEDELLAGDNRQTIVAFALR
jgi:Fe-S-cluster containining protein